MITSEAPSQRRLRLLDAHAYNGFALLTLAGDWRYFEPPGFEGFIAYELHRNTALVCGDPVCSEADLAPLMTAFAQHCVEKGWRFAFVAASARAGKIAARLEYTVVKIGEEPFLKLDQPGFRGTAAKKARAAINHARKLGVTVKEYAQPSPALDVELEDLAREWLAARRTPPMGFILRSSLLAARERKRVFYALYQGRIVAAISCAPAAARRMLYIEELVRRPGAPYGASELLISCAREVAIAEGLSLFGLGLAPLYGATRQPYGGFRMLRAFIAVLYQRGNYVYGFRSLNHFKKKFAPSTWEDSFFIYQGRLLPVALAVLAALAPGEGIPSLVVPERFAWLRRLPSTVLWLGAAAGVFAVAFAAWEFPVLSLPVDGALQSASFLRFSAGLVRALADVTLLAHRALTLTALALAGAWMVWRRARA